MERPKKACPATIGFRVETEHGKVLLERAGSLGVSVHELARHYVILALTTKDERAELTNAITELQKELVEIRKDVAVAAEALLTSAGKVSPTDASNWVNENLNA
jgi:hypothetical protein